MCGGWSLWGRGVPSLIVPCYTNMSHNSEESRTVCVLGSKGKGRSKCAWSGVFVPVMQAVRKGRQWHGNAGQQGRVQGLACSRKIPFLPSQHCITATLFPLAFLPPSPSPHRPLQPLPLPVSLLYAISLLSRQPSALPALLVHILTPTVPYSRCPLHTTHNITCSYSVIYRSRSLPDTSCSAGV